MNIWCKLIQRVFVTAVMITAFSCGPGTMNTNASPPVLQDIQEAGSTPLSPNKQDPQEPQVEDEPTQLLKKALSAYTSSKSYAGDWTFTQERGAEKSEDRKSVV